MAEPEREWVRNHKLAGFVAGRFQGEYAGEQPLWLAQLAATAQRSCT